MNTNELKALITKRLGINKYKINSEDAMEVAVRFDYAGCRYRVSLCLSVEKIDGGCLISDDDARRIEKMLRRDEWNGDGLPPVGCECECHLDDGIVNSIVVGYDFNGKTVVMRNVSARKYFSVQSDSGNIKPLRSEADKKRDEDIEAIRAIICSPSQASATAKKLYEAISTGKIHVAKLED